MKFWKWVLLISILVVILLVLYLGISPAVDQDVCLDGGGKWEHGKCIGRRPKG